MTLTLPDLPFGKDSLEPYISAKTLEFHHGKHHNAYVVNGNKLITGTEYEGLNIVDIIKKAKNDPSKAGIFNNAAQVWNHSFYWECLSPQGGGKATGEIASKIEGAFGSYEKFAEDFKQAAATQFGSGWAWLVLDGQDLKIVKTANADTPVANGQKALLTIDVWEHAYYLDYQNRRPDYISTFMDKLVNWDFVNQNLR